jgi:hypothetical protein
LNGGQCRGGDTFGRYTSCECPTGYGGDRCENHCPLDCRNGGRCIASWSSGGGGGDTEKTATYHCKCLGLFTGSSCSLSYVNCSDGNRCYNGGKCIIAAEASATVTCSCPYDYVGPLCRIARSEDEDSPLHSAHHFVQSHGLALSATVASMGLILGVLVFKSLRSRRQGSDTVEPRYAGVEMQEGKDVDSRICVQHRNVV